MHAIALPPNEDVHEAAKDEDKKAGVQSSTNVGEVPLGLNKDRSQEIQYIIFFIDQPGR